MFLKPRMNIMPYFNSLEVCEKNTARSSLLCVQTLLNQQHSVTRRARREWSVLSLLLLLQRSMSVYVCVWLQYSRSNQTPHEKSHSPIVCSHNRKHPAVWLCSDGHRRQGSQSPPCSPLAPLLFWYRSLSLQPGSRSLCFEPVIKANSGKYSTGSTGIQWLLWCCTDLLFKQQLTSHMQHFVNARGSNLRIIFFDLEHIFIWAVITVSVIVSYISMMHLYSEQTTTKIQSITRSSISLVSASDVMLTDCPHSFHLMSDAYGRLIKKYLHKVICRLLPDF